MENNNITKENNTVKAYHFTVYNGELRLKSKVYSWHIPKALRGEKIRTGDIVIVQKGKLNVPVIVAEVVREETVESKTYKPIIKTTGKRHEFDIEKIQASWEARKASEQGNGVPYKFGKAEPSFTIAAKMEQEKMAKAARLAAKAEKSAELAKQAAGGDKKAKTGKKGEAEPKPDDNANNAATPASAHVKANQFEKIRNHLHSKMNETADEKRRKSVEKIYNEYIKWLEPRQREIESGKLKYADAAEEIAKMTGVRIGKKG